jgi:uncharacterized protein (DUF2141 family)
MPTLKVECTNLRNKAGQVVVVVWDKAEDFRSEDADKAVATLNSAIPGDSLELNLGDLPAGEYAIAVMHDENENDKLDVTPHLHIPTEGLAFSNNPVMGLKGPDWPSCKFTHEAEQTVSIALKYWR